MNKTLYLLLAIFFTMASLHDSVAQLKELKVGDKVPDVFLPAIVHYPSKSAKLSEMRKGRAMILDFWFTYCGACISAMPKLDSLQKEFDKDLQILMVTYQNEAEVLSFFSKSTRVGHIKQPSVVSDTENLRKLFPHVGEPHQVWIDKDGIVKAVTSGQYTNKANIKKLIDGQNLNLAAASTFTDRNVRNAIDPVILHDYQGNKDKLLHYSYLSKYQKDLGGLISYSIDTAEKSTRVKLLNINFAQIYKFAYHGMGNMGPTVHKSTLIRDDTNPIPSGFLDDMSNHFCYDAIVRDTTKKNVYRYMQQQLDHAFNLQSSLEKRMIKCIVLKEIGSEGKGSYQTPKSTGVRESYLKVDTWTLNNTYLNLFSRDLNARGLLRVPFIDDTGFKGRVTFKMLWQPDDIPEMARSLQPYGLDLVEEMREIDVVVLRDRR